MRVGTRGAAVVVVSLTLASVLPAQAASRTAAPLALKRSGIAMVTLADGRPMAIGGGYTGSNTLGHFAEIYNEATDTWTPTAPMLHFRSDPEAFALNDGKVLVIGNGGPGDPGAEIYNPATNTWRASPMHIPRSQAASVRLDDGRIMVTGGIPAWENAQYESLHSVEIYDPRTDRWTLTGEMVVGRRGHAAAALESGAVLVSGGLGKDSSYALSSAEVFGGVWRLTAPMITPRWGHRATALRDGRVLVTGGCCVEFDPIVWGYYPISDGQPHLAPQMAEIWDQDDFVWEPSPMPEPRFWHTATALADGRVLIAGGHTRTDRVRATDLRGVAIYEPRDNTWTTLTSLIHPRRRHAAAFLAPNRLMFGGGVSNDYATWTTEIYEF